jgi:hypothetical protein
LHFFRVGLTARIVLALLAVGTVPLLAVSWRLPKITWQALEDQVLDLHSLAARTAASRVGALLASLERTADATAANPLLTDDPRSRAAQELLASILQARPDVAALALFNDAGESVIRAQRRDLAGEVEQVLSRQIAASPALIRLDGAGAWLRLDRQLPGGMLQLVADAAPLLATLDAREIAEEADLVLITRDGRLLGGSATSLNAFPASLLAAAASGQVSGAGVFTDARGEEVLGAHAPVAGSGWAVLSRQPADVAAATAYRMRRESRLALVAALALVVGLAVAARFGVVRPIRHLAEAQRRLAGLGQEPRGGSEIEQLRASFSTLERQLRERRQLDAVFLGRYQVREVLGVGAMGTVFRGWDPKLQRPVAIKTVRLDEDRAAERRQELGARLGSEAVTAARFNHPHIVAVYDVEDTPDVAFIAMELIDGVGLDKLLWRRGRLSEEATLVLGAAMAKALATAHAAGVVHRDVKPANLLLSYDGAIKMADFGISELLSSSTATGAVFGTPGYVPPEVLEGESFDERADLFALGVVLYECLLGVQPFAGKNLQATVLKTLNLNPRAVGEARPEISRQLSQLVERLMAKDPGQRPADSRVVAEQLEALVGAHTARWDPSLLPSRDERGAPETAHPSRLFTVPSKAYTREV